MERPGISRRASLALLLLGACRRGAPPPLASGLVSVGGSITEIVYALGEGLRLLGVDTSSTFPPEAGKLPQVGYQRALSAEGVLALRPALVLGSQEAGPPAALDQLKSAGVAVQIIAADPSPAGVAAKIKAVAAALKKEAEGQALAGKVEREIEASQRKAQGKPRPRVLAVFARSAGAAVVSGRGTAAASMIELAGAESAAQLEGNKPLTPEAAVAARPDILLTTTHGLGGLGGVDGLLRQPGIADTPAARRRRVVVLDDLLLLGFGPRTGEALAQLAGALHGAG